MKDKALVRSVVVTEDDDADHICVEFTDSWESRMRVPSGSGLRLALGLIAEPAATSLTGSSSFFLEPLSALRARESNE